MSKGVSLAAIAALSLLAACSHHGARSFSIANRTAEPPPHDNPPPPNNPDPDPAPTPVVDNTGTLVRTTNNTTGLVGGVLHVAGNTVLGLGDRTGLPTDAAGNLLNHVGNTVAANGVGGLPIVGGTVSNVVQSVDAHTNSLAQVQIVSLPVVGATTPGGNQAIGVSALTQTPSTGTVATVGALNHGAQQIANVSVGGTQVLGTSNPAAVTVGVLNGAQPNSCNCSNQSNPAANVTSTVTNTVSNVTSAVGTILGHP